MRLTFLGTAAANAFPEAFCRCAHCREARELGGPSLRKRSAALIDDDLLLDLGPDIQAASQQHGIPLTGVRTCLQTHPHADHLDLSHLLSRSPGFGVKGAPKLHFYASAATLELAGQAFRRKLAEYDLFDARAQAELNLEIHRIEPLQPFRAGPYRVIAFPANHAPETSALLYAISSGGRTIFYGADTAPLFEETWQAFHKFSLRFDAAVLDHTYGLQERGEDHLDARQVAEHAARLRAEGILKGSGRVFATHIAHPGNPVHPQLAEYASAHGYEIAYDGLQITV